MSLKPAAAHIAALGLDGSQFATRLKFIDSNLVNPRNHIAHGEAMDLSVDEYLVLHDEVIALIETFRNEIENASVLRRYERVAEADVVVAVP